MSHQKIKLQDFISLLKQNTTLTEVLGRLEDIQSLNNESQNTNVVYLDKEQQRKMGPNL